MVKKEWNAAAIVSLIYIIIYVVVLTVLVPLSSFAINGFSAMIQCFLGLLGMIAAFKNFRIKKYGRGAFWYFISLIPITMWVGNTIFLSIILSIIVVISLINAR